MHLEVDTSAVSGVADAVHAAAARARQLDLPPAPACEDLAASDAVRALLAVATEQVSAAGSELQAVARLVEVAAVDYARAEARATPSG